MIKSTISNSNFWLGLTVAIFIFMSVYPSIEFHTSCPDARIDQSGNESCIHLKGYLWEVVSVLSLGLDGDGSALSASVDEQQHRNLVPVMTAMIIILFYQKRKG
jgi:hypothetical protein